MTIGVVIIKMCVLWKALFAVSPLLPRNAGRIKDACGLGCKDRNADDFGLVGRMGALKLAESSIFITIKNLNISIAQPRQQSAHTDNMPSK